METKVNFEKKSIRWLGFLIIVLSLVYIFTTLGHTTWITWIAIVFGYFLVFFLIVEGGVFTYWSKGNYKNIGTGDVVVWLTSAAAFILLVNTTLLIQTIKNVAPNWIVNFATTTGVTVGIVAGLLGIVYVFKAGRFK